MSAKYNSKPEYRDIIPRIRKKAKEVLEHPIKKQEGSRFVLSDTRKMKLPDNSANLVVTSPPFLDVINYIDDNWLRFWFLGADLDKLRTELVQTNNLEEYKDFMTKSMKEMNRVLKKGSYAVIEVGDVSHKSKKLNLDEVIIELADRTGFKVEKLVVNHISSPKISKAFKPGNTNVGTKTNRCVVLKKI
jgi:DNA modification methylase